MSAGAGEAASGERAALVRQAFLIEGATAGWMTIEAVVAVMAGLAAHSLTLIVFGADSVIELLSAALLLWRLAVELKRGAEFPESVERRASRIGGALLLVLACYVAASAGWSLWRGEGQDFSGAGFAVTALAIPIMYVLARAKLRLAGELGSRALRTDAVESITCGYLSVAAVIGLAVQLLTGAWWVDGATSLVILVLLVREGREAWSGEACCDHD